MIHSQQFLDITARAAEKVEHINIDTLQQWQRDNKDLVLIDVREDSEWNVDRLPTAIHLGKGVIERDIVAAEPNFERTLVLYCGGGFRSSMAGANLVEMGYKHVISLNGGYTAWKQANLPLVSS